MERFIYLDHSATTPVRDEVSDLMQYFLQARYGNPSSLHRFGRYAREGVEKARGQVADAIGAFSEEIYFTSGGTEADNLALLGFARANASRGRHIIMSPIEHHAVMDSGHQLEKEGFQVEYLRVDEEGLVDLDALSRMIRKDTILISVMHANNEIGTVQPIEKIGSLARERGARFHTDAVQSLGKIPINVRGMWIDMLSASAHKLYGPKGVGCLYVRAGIEIEPLLHGGSQEAKLRPGTENVAGIVGFGLAVEMAVSEMDETGRRLNEMRDHLWNGIRERIDGARINGSLKHRVPGHLSVSFAEVNDASILTGMDEVGIFASAGAACASEEAEPSHVLTAIGLTPQEARATVRMTIGKDNSWDEIGYVLDHLPEIVKQTRERTMECSGPATCAGR
ncbi:MAG: cysteine desulfurase [Firmicutes bacterium]|nr:cysteine desulfurase [Bacillota bacterium]